MPLDRRQIAAVVDETIRQFESSPIDLLNLGNAEGELAYLGHLKSSYGRTIHDLLEYQSPEKSDAPVTVLEIGSFLGALCVALAKLGYHVTATDIPEFISNRNLQRTFQDHHIAFDASNLRTYSLPYADESFDVVIMCQVLEHLNFNPLPVINEINRVLKTGGLLYLAVPNLASLHNRLMLARGQSILPSIPQYLAQLDPTQNMIVGLHWREYTMPEVRQMLDSLGFRVDRQYYDHEAIGDAIPKVRMARVRALPKTRVIRLGLTVAWGVMMKTVARLIPSLRNNHATFAVKVGPSGKTFAFTDATRPAV